MSRLPPAEDRANPLSRRGFLVASGATGIMFGFSGVLAAIDPAVPGNVPAVGTALANRVALHIGGIADEGDICCCCF